MRARSVLDAGLTDGGVTQLHRLHAEAPLLVRTTGSDATGLTVHLVAAQQDRSAVTIWRST